MGRYAKLSRASLLHIVIESWEALVPEMEQRVAHLEREVASIPEILDLQARVNESRFAALFAEIDGIKRKLDGVDREVRALPRILAEMLAERDQKG
jgi:chromosome segregation ATPase